MQLDRRSILSSAVCGCLATALNRHFLLSQAVPADELEVVAAALRAQCGENAMYPVLIASKRFSTGRMTVLAKQPTPMQKAAHQVELPYLVPTSQRMAEAEELATAYNSSLERSALPLSEHASFNFPHRLLDDRAVTAFQTLNPSEAVFSDEIEAKRRAVSSRYRRLFAGSTALWQVSRVAFVSGSALAVVGLRSLGQGCYSEEWKVLERLQGTWHGLQWGAGIVTCT